MTTHIHTDGSCHGNPGPGGWAAVIITGTGDNCTLRGGSPETTNNIMELTAVIRGLRQLDDMPWTRGEKVAVHTDSQYIVKAFNDRWIPNWQRNGWRTAKTQPVANRDLWEELIPLANQHNPEWVWVKGHSGDHWNEVCDRIANEEAGRAAEAGQAGEGLFSEALASKDLNLFDDFFGQAATRRAEAQAMAMISQQEQERDQLLDAAARQAAEEGPEEGPEDDGPEEAPGAYNRGWRDGYEAARREMTEVLQSLGARS